MNNKILSITNKTLPIEYPLNIKNADKDYLSDILFSKINYDKNIIQVDYIDKNNKQIHEEINSRSISTKKEEKMCSFDYVFNNCEKYDIDYDESLDGKYKRIMYKRIGPSNPDEEDIDILIKNIMIDIKNKNNKTKKKHAETLCIESFLNEKTTFEGEDRNILGLCDDIFKKFLVNNDTKDI